MKPDHSQQGEVVVYGSEECPFTQRARRHMKDWNVDYRFVNVDEDKTAEELIASWNDGRAIRPTIDVNGAIFVNPEADVLERELRRQGFLTGEKKN